MIKDGTAKTQELIKDGTAKTQELIKTGTSKTQDLIKQGIDKTTDLTKKTTEKFEKLSKRLKLPELLNAITLIVVLHNAALLSQSLFETLGSIVTNGLAIIGLKDEEGKPHDVNAILGKAASDLMKSILGKQVWDNTVATWKKANRIYQATANITSTLTSMFDSTYSIFNVLGNRISKIGNALRYAGTIADNAYNSMNEVNHFNNPIIVKITEANEAADSIDLVTSEVLNVKEQAKELKSNRNEFLKALNFTETNQTKQETTELNKISTPKVSIDDE